MVLDHFCPSFGCFDFRIFCKIDNFNSFGCFDFRKKQQLNFFFQELSEVSADDIAKAAELDETASYVHISEESKRKVAEIPNMIGDSICSLCKVKFEDIFKLAMHKCPRIVHEEYKCPECEKVCYDFFSSGLIIFLPTLSVFKIHAVI